jgi:hypothetical protein
MEAGVDTGVRTAATTRPQARVFWGARLSPKFWGTRASINTGGSYTWPPLKFLFLEVIVLIERL